MSRILVVDDEANVRDLVRRFLTEEGHQVLEASNGESACQAVREEMPDMVVLDIVMPGLGGMATLERLKKDTQTSHIPVFVLTGHGTDRVRERSMAKGAADFLAKPFHPRTLLSRVRTALAACQPAAVGAEDRHAALRSTSGESTRASEFEPVARSFVGEHFGFATHEVDDRILRMDLTIKQANCSDIYTVYELDCSATVLCYQEITPVSKDFSLALVVNKKGQVVDRRGQFYD